MGVIESAYLLLFKVGGVAVVAGAAEKTLEMIGKEGVSQMVRMAGTVLVIYVSITSVIPLLNDIGFMLLRAR